MISACRQVKAGHLALPGGAAAGVDSGPVARRALARGPQQAREGGARVPHTRSLLHGDHVQVCVLYCKLTYGQPVCRTV